MTQAAGRQYALQPVKYVQPTNDPGYHSQSPRFVVKIDGNPYIGESFDYTQNSHGATDEATVTLPVSGDNNLPVVNGFAGIYPDWTRSIERSTELGNANTPVLVELWSGEPSDPSTFGPSNLSGLLLRFSGVVDAYSVVLEDNKTTFTCRSLAFPLTSTKITAPFPRESSVTTVAFIQQQAKRFGLKVAAPNLVGEPALMIDVLGGMFVTAVRAWYIWDLFLQCAQFDNVDIWVDRTGTIHYETASLVDRKPVFYIWNSNCKGLSGTHSPQFSKNIRVQVHSWTARTKTTSGVRVTTDPETGGITTSSYSRKVTSSPIFGTTESVVTSISADGTVSTSLGSSSGGGASGGSGSESESGLEKYIYFPKNKTLAQCEAMARQIWEQISQHEYAIKLSAPVTPVDLKLMDVSAKIVLSNHPMVKFNGAYFPREIVETFDPKSGWHWVIDAINHRPSQNGV
jgi:hypothetical protein